MVFRYEHKAAPGLQPGSSTACSPLNYSSSHRVLWSILSAPAPEAAAAATAGAEALATKGDEVFLSFQMRRLKWPGPVPPAV